MSLSEAIVRSSLSLYASLKFRPASPLQYNILSTFTLVKSGRSDSGTAENPVINPVSLGTGVKCLPEAKHSLIGDALNDSHAEVIARRGFIRWILSELRDTAKAATSSQWIEPKSSGKWGLCKGVSLHMYISTLPCEST